MGNTRRGYAIASCQACGSGAFCGEQTKQEPVQECSSIVSLPFCGVSRGEGNLIARPTSRALR